MIKLKQIDLPPGTTTTAVTDGEALAGDEAAELIAGKDGSGNAQFVAVDASGAVLVADGGGALTVDSAQLPASLDGGGLRVAVQGTPAVTVSNSVNLGTIGGAATETTLSALNTKVPTVGQKTMAASSPVVIASDQSAIPVSGTVTATVSGVATNATLTGGTAKAIARGGAKGATTAADITGTAEGADHQALDVQLYHGGAAINPTAIRALTAADTVTIVPSGTQAVSIAAAVSVTDGGGSLTVDGTVTCVPSGTQTITGTVTANLGTIGGAATETTLDAINTKVPTLGQKTMTASLPVVIASNQSAVPVSGTVSISGTSTVSVSNFPATQPVSAASLPLPTNAATSALQGTGNTSLGNIDIKTPALGQATMAASSPVVIASNQSAVPVSGTVTCTPSGTQTVSGSVTVSNLPATQAVSGTVSVTGVATESTLSAINTKTPAVGQATMAASSPVVIASNQSAVPVSIGTVKPASTAAVAADTALVVAISPNDPTTTATNSLYNVSSAASILNANTARTCASFQNIGTADVYLLFASSGTPSATNFSVRLAAYGGYFEFPIHPKRGCYTGAIRAASASGTNAVGMVEYV